MGFSSFSLTFRRGKGRGTGRRPPSPREPGQLGGDCGGGRVAAAPAEGNLGAMIFDISKTSTHDVYNLLIGLVAPRPIAWVTSQDPQGRLNAAPFSAFNYVCTDPPMLAIGVGNRPGPGIVGKDTAQNIRRTREFVVNVVNEELAEAMNLSAVDFPPGVNELEIAKLETAPSSVVAVPRIKQAPASLECRE